MPVVVHATVIPQYCIAHRYCARILCHCACKWERNIEILFQAKLDREINASFLWNEHGELYYLFCNFNKNSILNNWEKKQKSMATFFANEINSIGGDITGRKAHSWFFWRQKKTKINNFNFLPLSGESYFKHTSVGLSTAR